MAHKNKPVLLFLGEYEEKSMKNWLKNGCWSRDGSVLVMMCLCMWHVSGVYACVVAAEFSSDSARTAWATYTQVQRLCRSDRSGHVWPHNRQTLDTTYTARQGSSCFLCHWICLMYLGRSNNKHKICTKLAEFTEASSTADTAGMSRHRLAPYTVHYLQTLLILAVSGS